MSVAVIPSNLSVKPIVDMILAPDCPPMPLPYGGCGPYGAPFPVPYAPYASSMYWSGGYGSGILNGPTYPYWGSSPCQQQKLVRILAALDAILAPLPRQMQLNLLNSVVTTFVPEQGQTTVTLLEAAIIMRWPGLVARLLILGASPNVTTSGISLLAQLIEALPLDLQQGQGAETQAIIDLLNQSGSLVPPGYPGTHGYGIDRPYPYVRNQYNNFYRDNRLFNDVL